MSVTSKRWMSGLALALMVGGCATPTAQVTPSSDPATVKLPDRLEASQLTTIPADQLKGGYQTLQDMTQDQDQDQDQDRLSTLSQRYRWRRVGSYWYPYYLFGSRYYPYYRFRNNRYFRVYYVYRAPYYYPYYVPYYGPVDSPWMNRSQVVIDNYMYYPSNVNIRRGQTVTWVNRDNVAHTVTSPVPGVSSIDQFDSGNIAPGASYSRTFNLDGRFDYYCRLHPYMRGSVTVSGGVTGAGFGGYSGIGPGGGY